MKSAIASGLRWATRVSSVVKSGDICGAKSVETMSMPAFFASGMKAWAPPRPKSESSPTTATVLKRLVWPRYSVSAVAIRRSSGLIRNMYGLPPLPESSPIRGLDDTPVIIGIFASRMIGIIASVALEQCAPMIAVTFSWTSLRPLLAPSVGLQRLSTWTISILRPSNPPAAFASSTARSTPHFSHSEASAAGPVNAPDRPIRIAPCAWAGTAKPSEAATTAAAVATAARRFMALIPIGCFSGRKRLMISCLRRLATPPVPVPITGTEVAKAGTRRAHAVHRDRPRGTFRGHAAIGPGPAGPRGTAPVRRTGALALQ